MTKENSGGEKIFSGFPGHDRRGFPEGIYPVAPGQQGADAALITGSAACALYDCGMAYAWEETVADIRERLAGRKLDYILASHTHYDHIGALPYILDAFPEARVVGSAHGKYVFSRPGALKVIKELGVAAEMRYGRKQPDRIKSEGMRIDITADDGDVIDLGDRRIVCLETKGHTDCCLTFVVEPDSIMFASESTGVCLGPGKCNTAILKSYEQAMGSADKCEAYGAAQIYSSHYGLTPPGYAEEYFRAFREAAREEKEYVTGLWNTGLPEEKLLEMAAADKFSPERGENQPFEAFMANARAVLKVYEQYADEDKKYKEGDK